MNSLWTIAKYLLAIAAVLAFVVFAVPGGDADNLEKIWFGLCCFLGWAFWFGVSVLNRLDRAHEQRNVLWQKLDQVAGKLDTIGARLSALTRKPYDPR